MPILTSIQPLYAFSGFCVGLLVGMTGIGGGSLMTPLLILLFGVHPSTAVGTDLLFAASTKSVGTVVHAAERTVDWRLVGLLATGSVPATVATLIVLSRINLEGARAQHAITLTLGCVLLVTAVGLLGGRRLRERYGDRMSGLDPRTQSLLTILLGVIMAVLVTSTSVGAGAIGVTVLLVLHPQIPLNRLVGSDIAHAVPLTLLAGAGHWYLGAINWNLLEALLIGSVPGIIAGSYLASRARDIVIRIALAGILVVVGIRLMG